MAVAQGREKRRTLRLQPFVTPCKIVEGDDRLGGYLTDLSTEGARVSCNRALAAGAQHVVIEVRFSGRPAASLLPARIQWMQAGGHPGEAVVFGVIFDGLAAAEQLALESVVEEFQRRAALLD